MKVQFPITMEHNLAMDYKEKCRAAGVSFSAVVLIALEMVGPINSDLANYAANRKTGFFTGTYAEFCAKFGKGRRLNGPVENSTHSE